MAYYPHQLSRIKQGLCMKCAKPRDKNGTETLCRTCADRQNELQKKRTQYRLKNNICLYCGDPLTNPNAGTRCSPCAQKQNASTRKWRRRIKEEGKCTRCGKSVKLLDSKSCCQICYLKKVSVSHFNTVKKWEQLKELWDNQSGVCPYTGIHLKLGIDATFEHIYPRSRFPELHENPNNWQWIHYRVNEMKNDLTPIEFIDFISNILQHFDLAHTLKNSPKKESG